MLIGAAVLSLAACGNEDRPLSKTAAKVSTTQADTSASGASGATRYAAFSVFIGDSITEGLSYYELLDLRTNGSNHWLDVPTVRRQMLDDHKRLRGIF